MVNTRDGDDDSSSARWAQGSLRQFIHNANAEPGAQKSLFRIPTGSVEFDGNVFTIRPDDALPKITEPLLLDAATQTGYGGKPVVQLDGSLAGAGAKGLAVVGGGSTIRGLIINRFGAAGISLKDVGGNIVESNYIGTTWDGGAAAGNGGAGILIEDHSTDNRIGSVTAGNLILRQRLGRHRRQ